MRTTTLDKRIILRQIKTGQGHPRTDSVQAEATVCAAVRVPSLTFRSRLEAAGLDTSLTVTLWRSEFGKASYTHVLYDGELYRIASVGAGVNDLFVTLVLVRN